MMKKRFWALFLAVMMVVSVLPTSAFAGDAAGSAELKPGEIRATKSLVLDEDGKPAVDEDGYYTIQLAVQGAPVKTAKAVDVILCIDVSNSMTGDDGYVVAPGDLCGGRIRETWDSRWELKTWKGKSYYDLVHFQTGWKCERCGETWDIGDGNPGRTHKTEESDGIDRLDIAKDAAEHFATELLGTDLDIRMAVVAFGGKDGGLNDQYLASTALTDNSNSSTIISFVQGLQTPEQTGNSMDGGTNYTSALGKASDLFKDSTDRDKFVLFLSDGKPAYTSDQSNNTNWNGVNQANSLKKDGVTIYSGGIAIDESDSAPLKAIASIKNENTLNETTLYQAISNDNMAVDLKNLMDIVKEDAFIAAGREAVMVDVVNKDAFDMKVDTSDKLTVSDSKVTWDIGTITNKIQSVQIKVKPNGNVYGKNIATNGKCVLTYIDHEETKREIECASPTVDIPAPVSYKIEGKGPEEYKLPETKSYVEGTQVDVAGDLDDVETEDGTWVFQGWTTKNADVADGKFTMPKAPVVFVGTWTFEPAAKKVTYSFESGTEGKNLPEDIYEYLPANGTALNGETVEPVAPEQTTYETVDGTWTFDGWDYARQTVEGKDIAFKGTWTFEVAKYTVTFVDEDGTTILKKATEYEYGTPAADIVQPETPTKAADDVYVYKFDRWTPAVADVTGNAVYKAVYTATKQCDVTVDKSIYQLKDAEGVFYEKVAAETPNQPSETAVPAVKPGDTIIWKIVVKNEGEIDGSYNLTDWLSNERAVGIFSDAACETAVENLTEIKIAGSDEHVYYAKYVVVEADEEAIINYVKVTSGNKAKDDEAPAVPVANIAVTKTADKTDVKVGDKVIYTITVKNEGSVNLTNVVITDTFENGGKGTLTVKAGDWEIPELAAGETATIVLEYTTVADDVNDRLKNTAVAEGYYDGEKTVGESDTEEVQVTKKSDPITPVGPPALNKADHYAYIVGYPDGLVHPEKNITRAEVSTIFFRMLLDESREDFWAQENWFSDVPAHMWFNNAVSTLANAGLITGYPDGSFKPNANITRAEFATIAIRFFLEEDVEITENNLSDVKGHWAEANINLAYALNLINGYPDGTFRPDQKITRAEAMTIVNRVLERDPHKDHLLDDMIEWPDNMNKDAWYYAAVQEATNSHEFYRDSKNEYEVWTELLPVRDWAALEQEWSQANSSKNPGEVVDINVSTPEAGN